jgi:heme/copper-type cytochrome/quinol oxidase subunit 2
MFRPPPPLAASRIVLLTTTAMAVLSLLAAAPACAADLRPGWGQWWLPPVRSVHGHAIDSLFVWTFWITMITFVVVEAVLIVFLIKYRHRPEKKKAHFTHGNTKLEMAWTLFPAVIMAALAVANKGVWDRLRFNPELKTRSDVARILVVGQQFKWNVIYPGGDKKLGKYLIFPRPTDTVWPPTWDEKKKQPVPTTFAGVAGPASLPYERAVAAINTYVDQVNPLGKVFIDPDGLDDDWSKTPGREINIPVDRPVEVELSSKDVIHDFFLPNHRVKLDAVPGMRGRISFTATMTSRQRENESRKTYKLDELAALFARQSNVELNIVITKDSPGAVKDPKKEEYLYVKDPKATKFVTIIRNDRALTKDVVESLKTAGVTEVTTYEPGYWDLVCEELCGQGHATMQGKLVVLDSDEFKRQFETPKSVAGNVALVAP